MSSEMAWRAASLISSGAAKSGKPCERLTALCFMAKRVISRMTDSVNCSALAESMRRAICDMLVSGVDMTNYCSNGGEFLGGEWQTDIRFQPSGGGERFGVWEPGTRFCDLRLAGIEKAAVGLPHSIGKGKWRLLHSKFC